MLNNEKITKQEEVKEEIILDNSSNEKEIKEETVKTKSIEEMVKEENDKAFLAKTISSLQNENQELKKQFENFKKELEEVKQNKNFYNESKITNEKATNIQFDPKDDWWTYSKKIKGEI